MDKLTHRFQNGEVPTAQPFNDMTDKVNDIIRTNDELYTVVEQIEEIKHTIENIPDGAHVTLQVQENTEKLSELSSRTDGISNEVIETDDDSISIEDNNGNEVFHLDNNGLDAKNVKSNGKEVLTEHQDISGLATKEEVSEKQDIIPQVSHGVTKSSEEEQVFASDDYNEEEGTGEKFVGIGSYGVQSKAFLDMKGKDITDDIADANDTASILLRRGIQDKSSYYLDYGLSGSDPSEYNSGTYLDEKIKNVDANGNNFIFITDTHWQSANKRNSTLLVNYVKNKKKIPNVVFGGDIINSGHNACGAANELSAYSDEFFDAFGEAAVYAQGNHDSNYVTYVEAKKKNPSADYRNYLISDKVVYERTIARMKKDLHYDEAGIARLAEIGLTGEALAEATEWFKMHYWFDDEKNKNRYIILETGDSGVAMFGSFNLSYTGSVILQMPWLADVLKSTPEGYNVIVVGHMIGNNNLNLDDTDPKALCNILRLFKRREAGSVSLWCHSTKSDGTYISPLSVAFIGEEQSQWYRRFDFTEVAPCKKILVIGGHFHMDKAFVVQSSTPKYTTEYQEGMQIDDDAFMVVWTSTDSIGVKTSYSPDMERNTVTEQCFDIVTINDTNVKFTRIGAGNNRVFNY